jgi:nucleoside-diphosphate-sugar epimerase
MTTLVTGATGLLGGAITGLLLERGQRVRALLQPHEEADWLTRAGLEVCWGDLRDPVSLHRAVAGIDVMLHCAARTGPWGPQRDYDAVNVVGLGHLLLAAQRAGVRRIVHVSSVTVHGNDLRGRGDETSPLRVEPNPYNRSKIAGEQLVERLVRTAAAPITVVRPGWIYGAGDRSSFGRIVETVRCGRMVQIGRGTNHLPLIDVSDAARGVLLAAEAPQTVGRTYVLVNDEPVTQQRYLATLARELGVAPPRRKIPYRLAIALAAFAETAEGVLRPETPPPLTRFGVTMLGGDTRFSIERARADLGFSPQIGVDEGVRRGVAWHESLRGEPHSPWRAA